jgi:hypothetical protein
MTRTLSLVRWLHSLLQSPLPVVMMVVFSWWMLWQARLPLDIRFAAIALGTMLIAWSIVEHVISEIRGER